MQRLLELFKVNSAVIKGMKSKHKNYPHGPEWTAGSACVSYKDFVQSPKPGGPFYVQFAFR